MAAVVDLIIKGQYLAGQAFQSLDAAFSKVSSGIDVMNMALGMGQQAYNTVVGSTLEYAKQVRELSRTIGANAEETSALIQVADDFQVSYGTLQIGLETAIRKGISPTIEGLATMADRYNALQDPVSKTRFMMENFGRAGADLAPIMEKGADGIRQLAEETKRLGLAFDQNTLDRIEAYRQKIDNLGDKWQALALKAGPPVVDVLSSAADTVLITTDGVNQLTGALDSHNTEMIKSAKTYQEYIIEMDRARQAAIMGAAATNSWLGPLGSLSNAVAVGSHEVNVFTEAEFNNQRTLAASEQAYNNAAAAALAYSLVVGSGATQGIDGGYMGYNPDRGKNPVRQNPTYEFLIPGRASGGTVVGGESYLVGERGPEVYTPSGNGSINNVMAGGAAGGTVILQQAFYGSPQENADAVEKKIREMKRNGQL